MSGEINHEFTPKHPGSEENIQLCVAVDNDGQVCGRSVWAHGVPEPLDPTPRYTVAFSQEDGEWVATSSDFPSLSWLAATATEALAGLDRLIGGVAADVGEESGMTPERLSALRDHYDNTDLSGEIADAEFVCANENCDCHHRLRQGKHCSICDPLPRDTEYQRKMAEYERRYLNVKTLVTDGLERAAWDDAIGDAASNGTVYLVYRDENNNPDAVLLSCDRYTELLLAEHESQGYQ